MPRGRGYSSRRRGIARGASRGRTSIRRTRRRPVRRKRSGARRLLKIGYRM